MKDMQHQHGDDMGVFLSVCETGSFAAGSTRLGLSASAVAKAVARLEERLRIRLFQRSTRRLSLTAEGVVYRDACLKARREIERAEFAISSLSQEPSGALHVSLPPLFGARIVAPALYSLCRRWPNLDLRISTSTIPSDLLDGETDLAVRIGEVADTNGLMSRALGSQKVVLCASADYFADRMIPYRIEDLAEHALIASPVNGKPGPWQFRNADGNLLAWHPKTRLVLEGSLLTLSAIKEGEGLGLVPRWLVRDDLASGRLVSVLDDRIAGHLPIQALWPASPAMLPRLRVAIDAIVDATKPLLVDGALL
ncbi:LysR family transcriptional regulator [Rhizobium sp. RM]|uniref:LysR family transcriptional regulator n=1 Tax=Rhizobium sp. RM TaxID=2748079 RepID=UPI001AED4321|nr:LysR family transcriptional regulator [Rhizobium sp. RM]